MSKNDKHLKEAIKVAALELCCGDQLLRERLRSAIRALDRFLGRREAWPDALYARVQDVSDKLKSADTGEIAVDRMSISDVRRLAERILQLYADCHSPPQPN